MSPYSIIITAKSPNMRRVSLLMLLTSAMQFSVFTGTVSASELMEGQNRFELKVGTFVVNSMSTRLQVNPSGGALGTSIGFEQTLDLPDGVSVQRLDGHYRINKKQRIEFSYYQLSRAGTTTLADPIIIGGITIPAGSTSTTSDSNILKGVWSYSFINDKKYEFGLGAGLHITSNKSTITDDSGPATSSDDLTVPLPIFSFRGAWHITPKLKLEGKQDLFLIDIADSRGSFVDITLRLEHQTFKHIGFGAGLSYLNTDVQTKSGGLDATLESRYRGTLLYMKGVF